MTETISSNWTWIDTVVVVGYLLATTALGAVLSGKQQTMRDFFLGGRRLPWWAVSASIISTEISALTFVSLPSLVARDGGNFYYLQIGILGYLLARVAVAVFLLPIYYRQEIYSPYDYMGQKLGEGARICATVLFSVSGLLAQGARLYLTALIFDLVMRGQLQPWAQMVGMDTITLSIWVIGLVSIGWTLIGGVNTVIWTDVVLVAVFLLGAAVALWVVSGALPGGWGQLMEVGSADGKFELWNPVLDFTQPFTLMAAIVAGLVVGLAAFGTDQMMIQRAFCCRGVKQARWAVISSHLGMVVPVLVMFVGVGLYAFYKQYPMSGAVLASYTENRDRIFPLFILTEMPTGVVGLLMAAILAAAINGSILTALAQTTIAVGEKQLRGLFGMRAVEKAAVEKADEERADKQGRSDEAEGNDEGGAAKEEAVKYKQAVTISRWLVAAWGVVLCCVALVVRGIAEGNPNRAFLDVALEMSTYCMGALLGGFFLALMGRGINGLGFLFAAPTAVLMVFSLRWHSDWAVVVATAGAGLILTVWMMVGVMRPVDPVKFFFKTVVLSIGVGMAVIAAAFAETAEGKVLAWPWYTCVGLVVTVTLGWVLADGRREKNE